MAAAGLMLASCQGGPSQGQLSGDLKSATPADSLIYYFGQMRGAEYRRQAERDTTLADAQAKKAYLQGVQAGMNAVKNGDEAYNQGLFLGMQMALNIQQFKDDYDIELNRRIFMSSLTEAVNADSLASAQDIQREFYKIMGKFNEEKEAREKAAAAESLSQEAQKLNLAKISEDVYGAVTVKTDSVALKEGDNVEMEYQLTNAAGKDIEAPLPNKGKIGARNVAAPINAMLMTLKSGETGKFITSARALFGPRVSQLGLEPSEVVTVTLKASIATEDPEAQKGPKVGQPKIRAPK